MQFFCGYRLMLHRLRPGWGLGGRTVGVVLLCGWLWLLLACGWSAQAANWQAIAQSPDGQNLQYVDLDSLHSVGAVTRLETYWLERAHPEAKTYAVTEYHCTRQQYRDLMLDGKPQQQDWRSIEHDLLNQMVLDFACQSAKS